MMVGITEDELPIDSVSALPGFVLRSGSTTVIVAAVPGSQSPEPGAVIVMIASLYAITTSTELPAYLKVCCLSAVAAVFVYISDSPSAFHDSNTPVFEPLSVITTSP